MGTITMNSAGLPVTVSVGYDLSIGAISCGNFISSPSNKYVPYTQTFETATHLYSDSSGTISAISGYYSNGSRWRYWNSITKTFISEALC